MNGRPLSIPNLTPLRGIAAIMVAVFHFNAITAHFANQEQSMFLGKCYLMVDLFFILSGFIMLHVYGHEFSNIIRKKDFLKFAGARFARIFPLHFFTLIILVALVYGTNTPPGSVYDPNAILTNIFLLHSYGIHDVNTWNVPSWSISAEWCAYMIFPLLVFFLFRFKNSGLIVLAVLSIFLYLAILYLLPRTDPSHNLDVSYDYGYLRGTAGFIAGMIIYRAFQKIEIASFFNNDLVAVLTIMTVVFLLHSGVNDLLIILSFALLVLSVASNKKGIHKILQQKPLQFLGDISYSIYLTHLLVLLFLAGTIIQKLGYDYNGPGTLDVPFFTGLWLCAIFLVVLIIISSISYYVIEKPCRSWLNKKFRNQKIR